MHFRSMIRLHRNVALYLDKFCFLLPLASVRLFRLRGLSDLLTFTATAKVLDSQLEVTRNNLSDFNMICLKRTFRNQ